MLIRNFFFSAFLLIIGCSAAFAQTDDEVNWPAIPQVGASLQNFVPQGWYIEWDTLAALVPKAHATYVVVLRERDAVNDPPLGARSLHVIVEDSLKHYRLLESNHMLVQFGSAGMLSFTELNDAVGVTKNVLAIGTEWLNGNAIYKFRYDSVRNHLMLIGLDYSDQGRNRHPILNDSRNYLSGKRIVTLSMPSRKHEDEYMPPIKVTTTLRGRSTSLESTKRVEIDAYAFNEKMLRAKQIPENYEEQEKMSGQD